MEEAVLGSVARLLQDGARVSKALSLAGIPTSRLKAALTSLVQLGKRLSQAGPEELRASWLEILHQVEIGVDRMRISQRTDSLRKMLDAQLQDDRSGSGGEDGSGVVTIGLPVTFKRRGVETKRLLASAQAPNPVPNPALIKTISDAQRWFEDLACGQARSISELAKHLGVHQGDVSRKIALAFLAPDIVDSILDGRQPVELTAKALDRLNLPARWAEQRRLLGYSDS